MQSLREAEDIAPSSPPHLYGALAPEALPPGSRLDEFEIVRVLGAGGFGIVYLALDQQLLRYVAIKEFIPTALAARTLEGAIVARSAEAATTFAIGLDSFYNEGRLLARFDNPSLVRVFRFWKANGTAYMAMQYYPGQTLKEARRQMAAPPDEAWLRLFVERLLGALQTLHAEGVYHRDIAPDNILLLPDGQPVILDFGSARRVIGDRTQSLTAILKPNYSPVEQYADDAGMRQGGYTDLYALGGTVYFMLTGREPFPAVMRAVRDSFPVLAARPAEPLRHVSREFLTVIDWCLGVAPDERPQTVAEMRAALAGETVPPVPSDRHGVLIGDANQSEDASRATAPTVVASAPTAPTAGDAFVTIRRTGRMPWLILGGLVASACAAAFWATLVTTPQTSVAQPQTSVAQRQPAPVAASQAAASIAAPQVAEVTLRTPEPPASKAPIPRAAARPAAPTASRPGPHSVATETSPSPQTRTAAAKPASAPTPSGAPSPSGGAPCADMNVFARAACLSSRCDAPQWRAHPQCLEVRRTAEQRQRRMDQ